jgi:cytochrome oxidase Cu insertion factor (SCO1/SenC/PrrC family)
MRALHFATFAPIVLALAGEYWAAAQAPAEKTGLPIGARAPAFTLKDQHGKERTLAEFLQKGKVALVFYRSAGW